MKGKHIVPLILASITATTFGAQAQFSVKADYDDSTILEGDLISVSGFEGEGEIGEPVYLPVATGTAADVEIVVVDPRGNKITPTLEVSSGKYYFVPTLKGYYTAQYSAEATNKLETVTEELKILVTGNEYSIALPTNSRYIIPATVKTNTQIQIPMPTVKENDEELDEATALQGLQVTVTNKDDSTSTQTLTFSSTTKTYDFTPSKAGVYEIVYRYIKNDYTQDYKTDSFVVKDNFNAADMELNFSYKSTKPASGTLGKELDLPKIKVFDKNNSSVELEAFVSIKVKHISSGTEFTVEDYKFIPTLKGDYRVTYQASIPLFGLQTQESHFIISNVTDNERPEYSIVNNYEYTTVDGVTTITKVYVDADKDNVADDGEVVLYNAADYASAKEEDKKEALEKALTSTTYNIPSVAVLNSEGKATIKIPAIYAKDNYSDYSKLTFTRSVKSSTGLITEIKKLNGDGTREAYPANQWAEYTFTSAGDYTIRYAVEDEAGNSYIDSFPIKVLAAVDSLKTDGEYILPTLTFPALASYVKSSATLAINQPSATDKYDSRVETKVYFSFDKNTFDAKNEVKKLNSNGQLELSIAEALATLPAGSNPTSIYIHAVAYNDYATDGTNRLYSKITREVVLIDTEDAVAPRFVTAENNEFFNGTNGLVAKNTNITGTLNDKGMIVETGKPAFKQKDLVYLPDFVITDESDTNLNITLTVKDPYGKTVSVKNSSYKKQVSYDAQGNILLNTYTVQNGSFTVDYSGVYTISYTAKDAGGNIVSKTYGIRVQDTEKPTIQLSSYDPFTSSVEVGKFIEIPAATLTDKGETITEVTTNVPYDSKKPDPNNAGKFIPGTYWELVEGPSLNTMGTVGFTPSVAGEYVIQYYGWDAEGNYTESKKYTITATDSIKPTINLEKDYLLGNVAWDDVKNQVTVYAPGVIELYDGYRDAENSENDFDQTSVNDITLTVKVYDKNNNEIENVVSTTYEIDNEGNFVPDGNGKHKYFVIGNDGVSDIYATRYRFIAESQGTYTIKYIATDAHGNSTDVVKEVKVGDTDAPEVEWNDSEEDLITTANIGDYYEFNIDMITLDGIKGTTAIDVPETQDAADYKITVNMYNPSSAVVTNEYKDASDKENSYRWKFETSGTYELRIVAEDKAGNKITKSYNIVVAAEETETETVKPVVGTILIVISSLILVGVVAYFVVTAQLQKKGKKGPKARKSTK